MEKDNTVDLDNLVKGVDGSVFEYPMVADTPEGWPPLRAVEGNTWYQKALNFEQWQGQRVLPLKYMYDEDGNVVENPYYKESE